MMKKIVKATLIVLVVLLALWGVLKTVQYPDKSPGAYTMPWSSSQPVMTATYCRPDYSGGCIEDVEVDISPSIADVLVPSCPNYMIVLPKDHPAMLLLEKGTCHIDWVAG